MIIRARNLRAAANFIPAKSFRARRAYYSNEVFQFRFQSQIMFGFDLMLYVLEYMCFGLKDLSFVIDVSMMGVFWLEIKCWVLILMEFITHVVWKDRSFT